MILGLGGGSVARLARAFAPDAEILGIELDPDVVRLARKHLDLDTLAIEVEIVDAYEWLKTAPQSRERYDVILEDIFVGVGDDVHKPSWIPDPAHRLAKKRLAAGGLFVSNTLEERGEVAAAMAEAFPNVVSIETEDYDNSVLVGGGLGLSGRALRAKVATDPILRESLPILSFRSISVDRDRTTSYGPVEIEK